MYAQKLSYKHIFRSVPRLLRSPADLAAKISSSRIESPPGLSEKVDFYFFYSFFNLLAFAKKISQFYFNFNTFLPLLQGGVCS